MIRIAVVDDEQIILNSIHKKIAKILYDLNAEFEIQDFTSGKTALKEITEKEFDIIFLDIDMPDISGMTIAKKIRMQEENIEIVFITNKDELVYDAIKVVPFRFIRKSRFDEEIKEALHEFIAKLNNRKLFYIFSTSNGEKTVQPPQIRYVEVSSHKLSIHMLNESFITNGNLKDIEEQFYTYGFIKVHQSFLVNFRFINYIKRNEVILDNGTALPLSRSRYEKTKFEYMRLSREDWK
ncbi:MAG TPA: LytTR family DNA-binding domain-containing protein [Ruminococcus sp.]|nr:LytTR family DNA-binding domain-containing protein [Ruminococcus sp.]